MFNTIAMLLSPSRGQPAQEPILSPVEYARKESFSHDLLFTDPHARSSSSLSPDTPPSLLCPKTDIRIVIARASCSDTVVLFDSKFSPQREPDEGLPLGPTESTRPPSRPSSHGSTVLGSHTHKRPVTLTEAISYGDTELELTLAGMSASTMSTNKRVTEKISIVPLNHNVESSRTTRLVRPANGFGGSYARARRMQEQKRKEQGSAAAAAAAAAACQSSTQPHGQQAASARRRTVILTRSFTTLFSNQTTATAGGKPDAGRSDTRDEPAAVPDDDTVRWSPRFSLSIVLRLPVLAREEAKTSPSRSSFATGSRKGSVVSGSCAAADVWEGELDSNVALLSQNWATISRILCWIQQISEGRLVPMMRNNRGSSLQARLPPLALEGSARFSQLVYESSVRLVRALSIPRVLCGQQNWEVCRQEVDYLSAQLGLTNRKRFLSQVVTAFLSHHMDWVPQYIPKRCQRYYLEHVEATASSEVIIPARTIILSDDPIVARIAIFLLSHFLPPSAARSLGGGGTEPPTLSLLDTAVKGVIVVGGGGGKEEQPGRSKGPHPLLATFVESAEEGSTTGAHSKKPRVRACQAEKSPSPVNTVSSMDGILHSNFRISPAWPISVPMPVSSVLACRPGQEGGQGRSVRGLASQNLLHTLHRAGVGMEKSPPSPVGGRWNILRDLWKGPTEEKQSPSQHLYEGLFGSSDEIARKPSGTSVAQMSWCSKPLHVPGRCGGARLWHSPQSGRQLSELGTMPSLEGLSTNQSGSCLSVSCGSQHESCTSGGGELGLSVSDEGGVVVEIPFFSSANRPERFGWGGPAVGMGSRPSRPSSSNGVYDSGKTTPTVRLGSSAPPVCSGMGWESCYLPPARMVDDNVAGVLSSFHPDFAVQALKRSDKLEAQVEAAMRLEKTPMQHYVELLMDRVKHGPVGAHTERWLDVCSTLYVDLQTLKVRKRKLRRLVRLPAWLEQFAARMRPKRSGSRSQAAAAAATGKAAELQGILPTERQSCLPRLREGTELDEGGIGAGVSMAALEELAFCLCRDSTVVEEELVDVEVGGDNGEVAELLGRVLNLSDEEKGGGGKGGLLGLSVTGVRAGPASGRYQRRHGRMCSTGGMTTPTGPGLSSEDGGGGRMGIQRTQSHPTSSMQRFDGVCGLGGGEGLGVAVEEGEEDGEVAVSSVSGSVGGRGGAVPKLSLSLPGEVGGGDGGSDGDGDRPRMGDGECASLVAGTLAGIVRTAVGRMTALSAAAGFGGAGAGPVRRSVNEWLLLPGRSGGGQGEVDGLVGGVQSWLRKVEVVR